MLPWELSAAVPVRTSPQGSQASAYVALAAVCFFWGTTYLGIRMALESFPVWVLVATRFTLSGSLMLTACKLRGTQLPQGRELRETALFGILALGIGNSCLAFSETMVSSGMAAIIITTSPFWLVGLESASRGGERMTLPTIVGMLVGFGGVVLLVADPGLAQGGSGALWKAFLILQLGNFGWSAGSLLQRRQPSRAHPVVSGAVQQLATGLVLLIPALLIPHPPIQWSWRGVLALLWLVTFGSIVGYSAFVYSMDRLPVALVSIYTYINPVVAVILGYLFYREPFGWRETMAMLVIFLGVAIVKKYSHSRRPSKS